MPDVTFCGACQREIGADEPRRQHARGWSLCEACGGGPGGASAAAAAPGDSTSADDDPARRWGFAAGFSLVLGFLMPIALPSPLGSHTIWFWDMLEGAPAEQMLAQFLGPAAGIVVVLCTILLVGHARAIAWLMTGGALIAANVFLSEESGLQLRGMFETQAIVFLALCLGVLGSYVGISVMREEPDLRTGSILAGSSGLVAVGLLVLPLFGPAPAGIVFESGAWSAAPLAMIFATATLGFLGWCAASWLPLADPERHGNIGWRWGQALLIAVPILLFVTMAGQGMVGMALTVMLKLVLSSFGFLLLLFMGSREMILES